jgi:4-aminobutyrate aminotransferase-like enzyme
MTVQPPAAERILATYRERTKRSRELFERAGRILEGGTTRTSVFFSPYPCYIADGQGSRITDLDGNVRIDFLNNYTSLIHGHAYPPIVEAVTRQAQKGSAFSAPRYSLSAQTGCFPKTNTNRRTSAPPTAPLPLRNSRRNSPV